MRSRGIVKDDAWIALSGYAQPRLLNGRALFSPQNLLPGPDRIRYLEGLLQYANTLIAGRQGSKAALRGALNAVGSIPLANVLIRLNEEGGRSSFEEIPGIRNDLSLNMAEVSVAIMDGRDRRYSSTFELPAGTATPAVGSILRRLARGARVADLKRLAREEGVEGLGSVLERLAADGLIEERRPSARPAAAERDSLTWIGHAGVIFRSGRSTVWVDPVLRPRIAWTPKDLTTLFSDDFADGLLMDDYRNAPSPVPFSELPPPDLVCITHQDFDHFDLGTLMLIPDSVPIVVPRSTGQPWDVDLKAALRRILGPGRKVIALEHGERLRIGSTTVTAFPFVGEMPASLGHEWNCYLIETKRSAVACMADSTVGGEAVEFLARKLHPFDRPFVLCGREPNDGRVSPGYREGGAPEDFYNASRLWPWHLRIGELFSPSVHVGPDAAALRDLYKHARLRSYFPYAVGSTPWFRIQDPQDIFCLGIGSLTRDDYRAIDRQFRSIGSKLSSFPAKYGRAVAL